MRYWSSSLVVVSLAVLLSQAAVKADPPNCLHPSESIFVAIWGPAIAQAANGDTVEIESPMFWILPPFDFMRGDYAHKDPAGNVLQSGTWTIDRLAGAKFWECVDSNTIWEVGGQAVFRIRLEASDGSMTMATLEVGNPHRHPTGGGFEGVRLSVGAWGLFFDQPISGYTFFSFL